MKARAIHPTVQQYVRARSNSFEIERAVMKSSERTSIGREVNLASNLACRCNNRMAMPNNRHAQEEQQHDADEVFCSSLRAPAEAAFAMRGELMGASKAAWESGDKHKAKELSDEAHKEGATAEALSAEASQKIFEFKNSPERIHALEIDLCVRCCRRSCHS